MDTNLQSLLKAVSDLNWPKRPEDKAGNAINDYKDQLKRFGDVGWLKDPLFIAWDDWNLSIEDWDSRAPFYFCSANSTGAFLAIYLLIIRAREREIITKDDRGMSFFVYRSLPLKTTLCLRKGDNSHGSIRMEDKSDAESLVEITFPQLEAGKLGGLISQATNYLKTLLPDGYISRGQFAKLREGFNSAAFESEISNLLIDLSAQRTRLDQITRVFADAYKAYFDADGYERFYKATSNSLFATWMFFALDYSELTHAYYIPAHGFLDPHSFKGGTEESSGGLYVWCSKKTHCNTAYLKLHETYRGLRTSVYDWARRERAIALSKARQSAVAAIMSRNLSHNVGSHALANPKLHEAIGMDGLETRLRGDGNCPSCKDHAKKNPVQETKTRLSTFHQYIQTRLDFIARTLNPQVERTEPLFFVNDVLNGFFRQTVLLDTLLADRGFPMKTPDVDRRITFHVAIELEKVKHHYVFQRSTDGDDPKRTFDVDPGKTKRWYREGQFDAWKEKKDQGSLEGVEDVLVGVPGGMIGCHALYSFLENLMRNAAKYGAHCEDKTRGLEVHLRLREATQCDRAQHQSFFVLESWENLNDEPSDTALSHIRTHLGKDLIDPEGNTAPSGHGIQEMKIAAEFLSGKAKFHADDPDSTIATPSEYCAYLKGKALVQTEQALRCFRGAREFGIQGGTAQMQQSVIYELLMPKARLVGIVNTAIEGNCDGRPVKDSQSVFLHREISSLAKDGAAIGVILDTGQDENAVSDVVNKVVGLHHALPFRLLILAASEDRLGVWRKNTTITKMLAGYDQTAYGSSTDLPVRRIHLVAHTSIHQACLNGMEKSPTANYLGADGWEAFVLQMYHLWLTAFKGIPEGGAWKLIIGFEREAGQVSTRWTGLKSFKASEQKALNPSASMHIEVMVCEPSGTPQTSDGAGNMTWAKCSTQEERRSFLIFDNHGQVVKNADGTGVHSLLLNESPFFYQDFKGSRELSLAQSLESPPQDPFSFGFWIYSVVEGALFNVAILDERVAEASLVIDESTGLQLHYLHKMHIVPLFKVSRSGKAKCVSPGVESHAKEHSDVLAIDQEPPTIKWAWCRSSGEWQIMQVCSAHKPNKAIWPPNTFDAIIIHEGIVDAFLHKAWEAEDEMRLLALAPRVIRTSGRGSMPRHLARNLPFMEFSELSETIYRSRNKPGLTRAVCSVAGPMPEQAKEAHS